MSGLLEVATAASKGKVRPHNEDSTVSDVGIGLIAVADGMGGYKAGEVASAIAVSGLAHDTRVGLGRLKHVGEVLPQSGLTGESLIVRDAIVAANRQIFRTAQTEAQCRGMGTTIVMGMFYDNQMTIAHVGDSRMYRQRGDTFEQMTNDHSLYQELVDRGMYTEEEAEHTVNKNLVTRALGIDAEVDVAIREEPVNPGDIYLLCSDGLNDMVKDEEIDLTLRSFSGNLPQAAKELVQLANNNGGKDNISVILARPRKRFPAPKGWLKKAMGKFG